MMNSVAQLSPRLQTVANFVRPGARLADVGTDHAYLPIALLQEAKITFAIATDLREGPLAQAAAHARQSGVGAALALRCGDGLAPVRAEEADDIVIAGMGGELIAKILAATSWVCDPGKRLILQAMSSAEDLRRFLVRESFYIEQEVAVRDGGRVYTVICAHFSTTEHNARFPGFDYIGELHPQASPEAQEFAERQLRHLSKIYFGQQTRGDFAAAQTRAEIQEIAARTGGHPVVFAGEIYDEIDRFAPFSTAMSFDNPGLLTGSRDRIVQKALVALDITPEVVREAASKGAELIISHHPVIFHPLRALPAAHPAYLLAQHQLTAICAHTNLDMAVGGVNTCLARALGVANTAPFVYDNGNPEALLGALPQPQSPEAFADDVKCRLGCGRVEWVRGARPVQRVALCGGAGGDLLEQAAAAGADAFVTGEVRHHQLLQARALGITLVVGGHYRTERVVLEPLCARLRQAFPAVHFLVSERETDPSEWI